MVNEDVIAANDVVSCLYNQLPNSALCIHYVMATHCYRIIEIFFLLSLHFYLRTGKNFQFGGDGWSVWQAYCVFDKSAANEFKNFGQQKLQKLNWAYLSNHELGICETWRREALYQDEQTQVNFSSTQFMVFKKLATITFSHFPYISKIVHQKFMVFCGKKHHIIVSTPTKFHANSINHFWDIKHCHLHPFWLYLDIHASNGFDFWYGEALK